MSAPIVSVRHLGKKFHLGMGLAHNTLRDHIAHGVKSIASVFRGKSSLDRSAQDVFWALKDISFDVAEGEVIGIVGRNGAGKSTLLKLLSQITEPTEGEAIIRGRVASLLEVGTGFHSELTGRENIYLNGAILGMTKAEISRKFDEIVAFSEVEKFLDTPVKHYSSGMSMRLAFGVAAHLEPEILLIDEVLAVGDATFQQKCLGKMNEVAKAGRTVIFVSHNMAAMTALCSTGFYLQKGRLKSVGPINEIVNNYMSETVATTKQNVFCVEQRTSKGNVRIQNLEIASDGIPNTVISGRKMTLTITYEAEKEGLPIHFVIGVYDSFNTRLLALDSKVVDDLPPTLPARGKVVLEFPQLFSLSPGFYSINLAACLRKEMVDLIQGALTFTVEEGDFYGTGRQPYGKGKAAVLLKTKWSLIA